MYEQLMHLSKFSVKQVEYYWFDFHKECHENSKPMSQLVDEVIYPHHMENAGFFSATQRVVSENFNGIETNRIITQINTQ